MPKIPGLKRLARAAFAGAMLWLAACGNGTDDGGQTAALEACNTAPLETVLQAMPADAASGGTATLTVHYRRPAGDYDGWQLHGFGAAQDPGWNQGYNATSSDAFGAIYQPTLATPTGTVGYLFHNGDLKDHGGADQTYALQPGANEIWRIQGDPVTYSSNPLGSAPPDLLTVRVHYQRFDSAYSAWGLHLWAGSGLDAGRLPAGVVIEQWGQPVPFDALAGYQAGDGEIRFDLPVLNPQADASRTALEFIIHGQPPNEADTEGRSSNLRVDFAALQARDQVAEVWLLQGDATVYTRKPDTRRVSRSDARAVWLNRQLLQWPKVDSAGRFRLAHSARGVIQAALDQPLSGADRVLDLDVFSDSLPADAAQRFKYLAAGVRLAVRADDLGTLPDLLRGQLLLVQENADGKVQNASNIQLAGALDDWYAAAAALPDLGATVAAGRTRLTLWAPTAQQVSACVFDTGRGRAIAAVPLQRDAATGAWSHPQAAGWAGKYYVYLVDVFVPGKGLVRNRVTDPYSLSLTTDSLRSQVVDWSSAGLKPAGWDGTASPARVASPVDMVIYELHVRDFSANDASVPTGLRGKYGAFTQAGSQGMQHLRALAQAGLTDVHLLPVFDIASVPEAGCATPAIAAAAPDSPAPQAAVAAVKDSDCFNWGYDPFHFSAPEGSYASDAADGTRRVLEFRQMVQALHQTGLRVGMDVVYNHTNASGQAATSVLDRVVPGYYHRLDEQGAVTTSTCCANTATENLMMDKLMSDSVLTWAQQYRIDSFRFDLMGHQPRAAMVALQARLKQTLGRDVQLIGEGWNFGEVANGARFVQASQLSLNGSGIATFSDRARDHVRGGSPFDSDAKLISQQGFVNGLFYDPNALGAGRSVADLMAAGDFIKVGLAGSVRDLHLTTHRDEDKRLDQIDYNGQPAGYVSEPTEVVNYVENHDNQTLFDINVYKLPLATPPAERARVQMLAAAINAFSQGVSYFHAGIDTLRSKSLGRNSYNAGDWFNRLDWTYQDNFFGIGLPSQADNEVAWPLMQPLLADPALKPGPDAIAWTRDAFRDLLKIRASSTLLRLRTAADIRSRLRFYNTGSAQVPTVLAGHVDGQGYAGAGFQELLYLVNVDTVAHELTLDALKGRAFVLHPVQRAAGAADTRPAQQARYESATGRFSVPARTAVVYVVE